MVGGQTNCVAADECAAGKHCSDAMVPAHLEHHAAAKPEPTAAIMLQPLRHCNESQQA